MVRLMWRRVVLILPLLLVVSFTVFALIDLAPGDAAFALAGENPTDEQVEFIREQLNLDDPLLVRYGRWLGGVVQGDFGESLRLNTPVTELLLDKLGVTLSLVLVAVGMAIAISLVLGVVAARRPGGAIDRVVVALASMAIAMPSFWIGIVLVLFFAINRSWFPAIGYVGWRDEGWWEWFRSLILPGVALSAALGAELTLQLKGSLADVLRRDFVLAKEATGTPARQLVLKHGLKNAAVPVVTVLGFRLAQLLGGAAVVEAVFALPGLGTLAVQATLSKDVPVLLGLVTFTTLLVVLLNLFVDISYGYFNPKVRT